MSNINQKENILLWVIPLWTHFSFLIRPNTWRDVAAIVVLYVVSYLTSTYVIYDINYIKLWVRWWFLSWNSFPTISIIFSFICGNLKFCPKSHLAATCMFVILFSSWNKVEIIVNLLLNINHTIIRTSIIITESIPLLGTISPRGYNLSTSQCFGTDMVYKLDIFIIEIYSS
jgi:hypothetical protein